FGLAAFPNLVAHVGDDAYSMTGDTGAATRNVSVGFACFFIIEQNLRPYQPWSKVKGTERDPRGNPHRPDYMAHYKLRDPKSAKVWWEERKTKSLMELQTEVLVWIIAEEAKQPELYTSEEQFYLNSVLEKLHTSKK